MNDGGHRIQIPEPDVRFQLERSLGDRRESAIPAGSLEPVAEFQELGSIFCLERSFHRVKFLVEATDKLGNDFSEPFFVHGKRGKNRTRVGRIRLVGNVGCRSLRGVGRLQRNRSDVDTGDFAPVC